MKYHVDDVHCNYLLHLLTKTFYLYGTYSSNDSSSVLLQVEEA